LIYSLFIDSFNRQTDALERQDDHKIKKWRKRKRQLRWIGICVERLRKTARNRGTQYSDRE